jgi:cytochrome c
VKTLTAAACVALAAQAFPAAAADAANAARGKQLYETRCVACHSLDENRVGPAHRGVFGRKAGSAPGYDYSAAVKKSKMIWNEKSLDAWLQNPEKAIPGQKMGFTVPEVQDRRDLVEFLKSESKKKP